MFSSKQTVGQLGRVEGVNTAGNAIVIVKGRHWIFNPLCLSAAPDEKAPDVEIQSMKLTHLNTSR